MRSASDRGKKAESAVAAFLAGLSVRVENTWMRIPDAHGGSKSAKPADFFFLQAGTLYVLEVKSTLHEYRLPHSNVDAAQVGRMRRWELADAESYVLVYHETLKSWRLRHVDYFLNREGGSWDFRQDGDIPGTLAEKFNEMLKGKP